MFPLEYSRTSKQRPPWGQEKVAIVEGVQHARLLC